MNLEHARHCEQQGDFSAAESVYREILARTPDSVEVLRHLAINLWQQKRLPEATETLRRATQLDADNPELYSLLGVALASQGQTVEAIRTLCRVIAINPDHAGGHYNLGNLYAQSGQHSEAIRCFRRAVELQPDFAEAHFNLGNQLRRQHDLDAAVACYEHALAARPASRKAHNNLVSALLQLGESHSNHGRFGTALDTLRRATTLSPDSADVWAQVGFVLAADAQHKPAIDAYQRAISLRPDFTAAHVNLGALQRHRNNFGAAEQSLRTALDLDPGLAEAHCNLGDVLIAASRAAEAVEYCRRAQQLDPDLLDAVLNEAIALVALGHEDEAKDRYERLLMRQPNNPVFHYNLAVMYTKQALWNEAEEQVRQALAFKPDYAEAHCTLAALKLGCGDMLSGWQEYEWRWKCTEFVDRPLSGRPWDGSWLTDTTILLRAEQGLGDTLQFMRFARKLKKPGVTVLLECQRPLVELLSSSDLAATVGVDQLLSSGDPLPSFDCFAPLMSLPYLLGITVEELPVATNYLLAEQGLVKRWEEALTAYPGFRIGVSWQSNVENRKLKAKSFPLAELEPLATQPGVHLISLQKHEGSEQVSTVRERFTVADLGEDFDETAGAFMDTAAVIRNLDLVVCCDSAVGHLAGALGVETWVALPHPSDWRWLRQREDSPWYPLHRLFRQSTRGDWSPVFQQMANVLRQRLNDSARR